MQTMPLLEAKILWMTVAVVVAPCQLDGTRANFSSRLGFCAGRGIAVLTRSNYRLEPTFSGPTTVHNANRTYKTIKINRRIDVDAWDGCANCPFSTASGFGGTSFALCRTGSRYLSDIHIDRSHRTTDKFFLLIQQ